MRVIRIVSELDFGGVEKVLANSLPTLHIQKGLELKLIVLGQGGKVADELAAEGIAIQILGFNPRIPNLKLVKKLHQIISVCRPDVVHTQGGEANFHGIWAAKLAGVPMIIGEEIGIPNHHSFWKWIFRWVYQKADSVIAISEAVKKHIVALEEVKEKKVKVVYNPVGSGQWAVHSGQFSVNRKQFELAVPNGMNHSEEDITNGYGKKKKETFVFVTTCRLVPIKNLDRLINAFVGLSKENPDRELFLKIVGDGPDRKKLEYRAREQGIGNWIAFEGFQENVWPFLQVADAFILPSLSEGSSVSLAEAMIAGLPSIVTHVGGAIEILGDSQSGFLINPLDTDSIKSAMQQMIDLNAQEHLAMSERAMEEAKRFSVNKYIESLMAIYTFSDFILKPSDF